MWRPHFDSTIVGVLAWEALDSRGRPTVGCEVRLAGGKSGSAVAPSGKSTGSYEARELRDGNERYSGLGVRRAVTNVANTLSAAVRGLDACDQERVDAVLRDEDGTAELNRLGANAIVAVSLAVAVAGAAATGRPLYRAAADEGTEVLLPLPMVNVLSGGVHAHGGVDLQDVLVIPVGASSFSQALEWASKVRASTAQVLKARGLATALVADEGGFGPALPSNRAAIEVVSEGIDRSGLRPDDQIMIGLDLAANQFYKADSGFYVLSSEGRTLLAEQWIDEIVLWVSELPIVSVEDVMAEDDWEGWRLATSRLASLQVLGDDIFVSQRDRFAHGIELEVCNAVLVKPNQVGTLSDAHRLIENARAARYATVLSARSGDTEDTWLADLAVAWRTGQIKVGSTTRSERTAKWNRLLQIEAELGAHAVFAGRSALAPLQQ